jgi:hypothetical protein
MSRAPARAQITRDPGRGPAGLTGDQDHLAFARLCLGPAPKQQFEFLLPPNERFGLCASIIVNVWSTDKKTASYMAASYYCATGEEIPLYEPCKDRKDQRDI